MAQSDPTLLTPNSAAPTGAVAKEEWFERKFGEFTMQAKLPCFHDAESGEWFVDYTHWTKWEDDLVVYFIHNGYTSPEIEAFIQSHALAGE